VFDLLAWSVAPRRLGPGYQWRRGAGVGHRLSGSETHATGTNVKASFLALHSCWFFFPNHFPINVILAPPNCSPSIFDEVLNVFYLVGTGILNPLTRSIWVGWCLRTLLNTKVSKDN
jgi:hypothetical protein